MNINAIIQGHVNEIFGINKNLSNQRLKICYSCRLYSPILGGVCSNKLWMNPFTGDISEEPKDGYKNGCGCRLLAKTKVINAKCPFNKW